MRDKRPLGAIEQGALALGLVFVAFGALTILYPSEGTVIHPAVPYMGSGRGSIEHLSQGKSQVYGGIAVVIGVGISWAALQRR